MIKVIGFFLSGAGLYSQGCNSNNFQVELFKLETVLQAGVVPPAAGTQKGSQVSLLGISLGFQRTEDCF